MSRCSYCLVALLGLLPLASCGAPSADGAGPVSDDELVADASYIQGLALSWREGHPGAAGMPLDFGDDRQLLFVRHHLEAAGRTAENSPRIFEALERKRQRDINGLDQVASKARAAETDTGGSVEEALDCAHLLPITDDRSTTTMLDLDDTLQASCFGGADYVYGDIVSYLTNAMGVVYSVLGTVSGDEWATGDTADEMADKMIGKDFDSVVSSVSTPAKSSKSVYFESLFIAINDATGAENWTARTLTTPTTAEGMFEATLNHPTDLVTGSDPTDLSTRICLERTTAYGSLDCDYGTVDADGHPVWVSEDDIAGIAAIDASSTSWEPDPDLIWYADSYDVSHLYVPMDLSVTGTSFTLGVTTYTCGVKRVLGSGDSTADAVISDPMVTLVMVEGEGGYCNGTESYDAGAQLKDAMKAGMDGNELDLDGNGDFSEGAYNIKSAFLADFGTDCVGYEQNAKLNLSARLRLTCYYVNSRTGDTGDRKSVV